MRVLIADDNQDAADTLATVLRLRGHEVRVAYDGQSAVAVARRFEPHAALLDIQMPKMHGGDVALHLRRQPGLEGTLIVAASASDPDDGRLDGYDGVFDAHLRKPCDFDRLEELLAGCRPTPPADSSRRDPRTLPAGWSLQREASPAPRFAGGTG